VDLVHLSVGPLKSCDSADKLFTQKILIKTVR